MTEEPSESQDEQPPEAPVAPDAPTLSGTEKLFVRLTLWQTVLAVAGVIIAIVALYAALTESEAVRHQTAAAVWPFVQFSIDDYDSEDSASFKMSFTNAGVGPARMRDLRLIINGEPTRNWEHAVKQLGGSTTAHVSRSFLNNRVLSPDETIDLLSTNDADLARRFQAAIANPDNSITYCYCSIFDECWLADSRQDIQNPELVEACPDFGGASYGNE